MDGTFYFSEKRQKELIKKWLLLDDEEYKKKSIISSAFYIIALIVVFVPAIYIYVTVPSDKFNIEALVLSILVGAVMGVIVFIIANSLKNKSFKDCGFPYTLERRGVIKIYEDGLEHMYHDVRDKTWSESMTVYRIPKENINRIVYYKECHKVTIIGAGELITYDDYASKRVNYQNSQRVFYGDSDYSFFLAIDESEQAHIVELLSELHSLESV